MNGILKLYSDVESVPVEWLWYPYIPSGKITLLQGDPGDGKSTMMMNVISCITNGVELPDGQMVSAPKKVIYQCSEDGVADTIKPRLEACGADCKRIAFLDEELMDISLDDEKLRNAIAEFKANLLVIDPFQAYLGDDVDLSNAKKVRKLMRKLNIWASAYDCAILLIGHMTKKENAKDLYRGLGSIDLVAAARSVLQVYRMEGSQTARYVKHVKSSLAPKGKDIGFELLPQKGFRWLSAPGETGLNDCDYVRHDAENKITSKDELIVHMLIEKLREGPVRSSEMQTYFNENGIGIKRLKRIKKEIGIKSVRKESRWYWTLPG